MKNIRDRCFVCKIRKAYKDGYCRKHYRMATETQTVESISLKQRIKKAILEAK